MPGSVSLILHSVWNSYIISSVSIPEVRKRKNGRSSPGCETNYPLLDFVYFREDQKHPSYSENKDVDGLEL
jgi:hypothetical protein